MTPSRRSPPAAGYACAAASVGLAVGGRLLLDPLLGDGLHFSTLYFAILVTVWYGGFRPALAAVILGGLAADYFLLPPRGSFSLASVNERVGMVLYLCTGVGIAALGGAMEAARRRAEASAAKRAEAETALQATNEQLEARVAGRTAELESSRASTEQSEARMGGIVNSAMDAVISVDGAQRVVLFNAAAERMFRCPAAEAMGQPLDRFIPPSYREQHRRHIEGFGETGVTSRSMHSMGELSGVRSSGEEFLIEASISQVEVAGQKIYTAIIRDITDRRRAEAAGILLAAIVESSTDAIVGKDLNGVVTSWNAGAEGMFGYSAEEMVGRSITRIIPPERQNEEEMTLAKIRRGERVEHFETVRMRKDGGLIDVSLTVSPIKDSSGEIIGASKVARDMTDWKRAVEALRESEERMQAVTENLTEGLIFSDIEGRVLHWNRAGLEMHGFASLDECLLKLPEFAGIFELATLDGAVLPVDQWPLARVLRGEPLRDMEVRIRRHDPPWERIFNYSGAIIHDASGKPHAFLAIGDITERKRAEAARRASEAHYRTLFEYAPDGILIGDPDSYYLDANGTMCRMLGYCREELIGLHASDIIAPADAGQIDPALAVIKGGAEFRAELRFRRKDGSIFPAEVRATTMPDGNLLGMIHDITERKRSDDRVRWLASFPEQNPNPIVEFEREGGAITYANPEAIRAIPDLESDGLGHPWLAGVRALVSTWDGRGAETMRLEAAFGERHFLLTASYIGASQRVRVYGSDITDRMRAEAAISKLNEELEDRVLRRTAQLDAANKELEAFSYSVSHDLRAPLRAVDGFSQAVLEDFGPLLPDEGRRYLETIRQGAQRMGALIDDLLTFSRLSRAPLNKKAVDTGKLVRDILGEPEFQTNGRKIEVRIGELPACEGDPALLRQVWTNLLSNAFKYTQRREEAVVEIGCERGNGAGVYFVRDNGSGFDMRYADKLFGVFQRLHRAEDYEGTGVGLAIVQRVVRRHGGRAWADGAVDRGATFYFTLEGDAKE